MLPQRFVGNINSEAVVQNRLSHPVRTRFLRFVPLHWNPSGWMGLRLEVFGCSYSEFNAGPAAVSVFVGLPYPASPGDRLHEFAGSTENHVAPALPVVAP